LGTVFESGPANQLQATHTHSPKSQGMNTSIHDSWNLAWKLNLAIRGLAKPCLLATYEEERRQVAEDLLDYDYESVNALIACDTQALADNIHRNVRFTSGFGADYAPNLLNVHQKGSVLGDLRVGTLPPPAKVTRFIDANPVDIQLDIPMLGRWRGNFVFDCLSDRHRTIPGVLLYQEYQPVARFPRNRIGRRSQYRLGIG
jgi:phenol 2-monooxygenase